MKAFSLIVLGLAFCLAQLMTGCATFKSDLRGKSVAAPTRNYGADPVSVLFIFSHFRQTRGLDAIPKLDKQHERIFGFDDFFQDALNEFSNIQNYATFTEYASDVNDPARRVQKDSLMHCHDFIIKLKFMREKSFTKNFLGMIASSISLTVLPIPYNYAYSITVEVFSQNHLLKNYTRSASLTKWVQTLLIFIYPFHPAQRKKEELYVEFLHDIFRQIETEKILKKSPGE